MAEKTFKLKQLQALPNDFVAVKTDDSLAAPRYGLFDVEYQQLMLIPPSEMELWRDSTKKPQNIWHYKPTNGINSKKWVEDGTEPLSAKGPVTTESFESLLEIYRMETVDDIDDPDQVESDPYQYENNYIQQLYDQYYSTEPKQDPKKIFVVKDDMPESLQKRIREIVAKLSLETKTSKVAGNDVIIDDSNFAQYVKRYKDLIPGAGKNTKIESIRYASVFGKLTENLNRVLVEGMQEIPELEAAIDDAVEYRRLSPKNAQHWEQLKQYYTNVKKQTLQNKQKSAEKIAPPKSGNSSARYVHIPKHIANRIGYSTDGLMWGDRKYFVDRKISNKTTYYIVTGDIDNQYNVDNVKYYSSENQFSKENLPRGGHAVTDWGKVDDFMKSLSLGAFQGNNNNIFFVPGAPIPKPKVPELPLPPVTLPRAVKPPALNAKPPAPVVGEIPAIAIAKPKAQQQQINIPKFIVKKPPYVEPGEIKVEIVPPKPIIRPEVVQAKPTTTLFVARISSAPLPKTLEQRILDRVTRATKQFVSFQAKAGEKLAEIAKALKIKVDDLVKLNPKYNPNKGGTVILPAKAAEAANYTAVKPQIMIPEEAIESLRQQADSADELVAERAKKVLQKVEKTKVIIERPALAAAVGSNLDQFARSNITIIDRTLANEINDILQTAARTGDYNRAPARPRPANPNDYRRAIATNIGDDAARLISDTEIKRLEAFKTQDDVEISDKQYKRISDKLVQLYPQLQKTDRKTLISKLKKLGGKTLRGLLGLWPQTIALELIFAPSLNTTQGLLLRDSDVKGLAQLLQDPKLSKEEKTRLIDNSFTSNYWDNDDSVWGAEDPPRPILRVADNSDGVDVVTPYNADKLTVLDLLYGTYKKLDLETLIEQTESLAGRWDMQLAIQTTGGIGASEDKELTDIMIQAAQRSKTDLDTRKFMENKIQQFQGTAKYLKTLLVYLPKSRREAHKRYFKNAVALEWLDNEPQEEDWYEKYKRENKEVTISQETVDSLEDAIKKGNVQQIVSALGKRSAEIIKQIPDATSDLLSVDIRIDLGLRVYNEAKKALTDLYQKMAEISKLSPDESTKSQLDKIKKDIEKTQATLSSVARYETPVDAELTNSEQKDSIADALLVPINDTTYRFNQDLFPAFVHKLELEHRVPPGSLQAIAMIESSGGKNLYGDKEEGGSYGAFQVLSKDNGSFGDYKQDTGQQISKEELAADPILATEIGAWYFAKMYRQTNKESRTNKWSNEIRLEDGSTLNLNGIDANLVRSAMRHNGGPGAIDQKTGAVEKPATYDYAKKFVKYYKQRINESYNKEFKNSLQSRLFERLQKEKQCETY